MLEPTVTAQQLILAEAELHHTNPEITARRLQKLGALKKQRDLSHLAGTWTEEEYQAFEASVASLQEVVEED